MSVTRICRPTTTSTGPGAKKPYLSADLAERLDVEGIDISDFGDGLTGLRERDARAFEVIELDAVEFEGTEEIDEDGDEMADWEDEEIHEEWLPLSEFEEEALNLAESLELVAKYLKDPDDKEVTTEPVTMEVGDEAWWDDYGIGGPEPIAPPRELTLFERIESLDMVIAGLEQSGFRFGLTKLTTVAELEKLLAARTKWATMSPSPREVIAQVVSGTFQFREPESEVTSAPQPPKPSKLELSIAALKRRFGNETTNHPN